MGAGAGAGATAAAMVVYRRHRGAEEWIGIWTLEERCGDFGRDSCGAGE